VQYYAANINRSIKVFHINSRHSPKQAHYKFWKIGLRLKENKPGIIQTPCTLFADVPENLFTYAL